MRVPREFEASAESSHLGIVKPKLSFVISQQSKTCKRFESYPNNIETAGLSSRWLERKYHM